MNHLRHDLYPRSGGRGFTLLELLVVMAIIGIITAVVVPRVGNSLSNLQLKSSARSVAACLRYANSKVMTRQIPYVASFDFEKGELLVSPLSLGGSQDSEDKETVRAKQSRRYRLPEGQEFSLEEKDQGISGSEKFAIVFFENGTCSGGRIFLANKSGKAYAIDVDLVTSQVSIESMNHPLRQ